MSDMQQPERHRSEVPLPKPNVVVARSGAPPQALTPEAIRGLVINPIYTGVGPYPRMVEDEVWVRACAKTIEEEGLPQFLVNLLHVLRGSFDERLLKGIFKS